MMTSSRRSNTLDDLVMIGDHPVMRHLDADITQLARSEAKVLLTGETGTGKEVVARLIHRRSRRSQGPFVTINCAGVPDTLLESEFFGHVKGSFTGAHRDNPGLLRQAHRGTVFLDEVGEMSLRLQALLLRFLETGEVQTVGGGPSDGTHADVRVVAATNRDLHEAVAAREFREDLYYRLNVLHLKVPPLRTRGNDIELLARHYIEHFARQHAVPTPELSPAAIAALVAYQWPGNVRELKNAMERLVLRAAEDTIQPSHLPSEITAVAAAEEETSTDGTSVSHRARVETILDRMLNQRESFWVVAYPPFMSRDLTRDDVRFIIRTGLDKTRGSYRMLLELFNMAPMDYKRFLGFLKQHDCHLPFQRFRMVHSGATSDRRAPKVAS
jgi:transcriptional regulator with PAS, ATPase and Fis domain